MKALELVTRAVYAAFGVFYMALGTTVLLLGTDLLPHWLKEKIFDLGHNIPDWMHLIQEIGTLWIFVGMLLLWFAQHYWNSLRFHWAVTVLFGLDAWVHWFSPYGQFEFGWRQIVNAIPFAVFLVLGLLRRRLAIDSELPTG